MSLVKIEDGIPMPEKFPKGGRRKKYPWDEIEVGQSFVIPVANIKNAKSFRNARAQVYQAQLIHKRIFTTKQTTKGLRVWRVS